MKRLLAMIMALMFSMSNNVDYQTNADEPFNPAGYYMVEGNEAPDYRYITQNYSSLTSSGTCLAKSTSREHSVIVKLSELGPSKYWVDYSHNEPIDASFFDEMNGATSYTFSGTADIVAPQACIVKTKSTDGGGHSMLLETTDGHYQLYISNMERWFCCRNRTLPPDADPSTYTWTHTANVHGYTIPAGYLIGKAQEGTVIEFRGATNGNVSIKDFYSN